MPAAAATRPLAVQLEQQNMLTEDDKHWMLQQLESDRQWMLEQLERVETKLLTEFHK